MQSRAEKEQQNEPQSLHFRGSQNCTPISFVIRLRFRLAPVWKGSLLFQGTVFEQRPDLYPGVFAVWTPPRMSPTSA